MGFRFRKQVKIFPGMKLNLTKKGISSMSAGKKGSMINVGKDGNLKQTIGIPGTGLSYQTDKNTPPWLFALIIVAIVIILVFGIEIG